MHTEAQLETSVSLLPLKAIDQVCTDIAKKTKKKRIRSGNLFFRSFCAVVAKELLKPSSKEILVALKAQYKECFPS